MLVDRTSGVLTLSVETAQELCGGAFPDSGLSKHWPSGFVWAACDEFRLEDGVLVPYGGGSPAPGPDLRLVISE